MESLEIYKGAYIRGHDNSDVDSVVSAWLIQQILAAKGIKTSVMIPGGKKTLSESTLKTLKYLKISISSMYSSAPTGTNFVLVDHSHLEQRIERTTILHIFDHHLSELVLSEIPKKAILNIEKSSSCAYLIYKLFKEEHKWTDKEKLAVLVATYIDTMYFLSPKLISSEKDETMDFFLNSEQLLDNLRDILIPKGFVPDFLDFTQNIKHYYVGPKENEKKNLSGIEYDSAYVEVNIPNITFDDMPCQEIEKELLNITTNFLFCIYDFNSMKTKYFLKLQDDNGSLGQYIIDTGVLDGIVPRGTSLQPIIRKKYVIPRSEKILDLILPKVWDFLVERNFKDTEPMAQMFLKTKLCDFGLPFENINGYDFPVVKCMGKYICMSYGKTDDFPYLYCNFEDFDRYTLYIP